MAQARAYEAAGADAISVLTEPDALRRLARRPARRAPPRWTCRCCARTSSSTAGRSWEAADAGADAVLLIVAILSDDRLHEPAPRWPWTAASTRWWRSTTSRRRDAPARAGCTLVGINNRDLVTLEVDLATTEYLAPALGPCMFPRERERHLHAGGCSPRGLLGRAGPPRRRDAGAHVRRRPAGAHREPEGSGVAGVTRVKVCGLDARRGRPPRGGARRVGARASSSPEPAATSLRAGQRPGRDRSPPLGRAADASSPRVAAHVASSPRQAPSWIAAAVDDRRGLGRRAALGGRGRPDGGRGPAAACARTGCHPLVIAAADTPDAEPRRLRPARRARARRYGGTGPPARLGARSPSPPTPREHLVLAGGLNPANVAAAIARAAPGRRRRVERRRVGRPGVKDAALLRAFFAAVDVPTRRGGPAGRAASARRTSA